MKRLVLVLVACGGGSSPMPPDVDAPPDECVPDRGPPATVFLNRGGGAFTLGSMADSSTNTTPIIDATKTLPAPVVDDADWATVVACITDKFRPFNIEITDVDPGAAEHFELVVIDTPQQIGVPNGNVSVSPVGACTGSTGQPVVRGISFLMWTSAGENAERCWVGAQALGSMFGLDHAFSCPDLQTFQTSCGPVDSKTFTDEDVPCGEFQARACLCGAATQNSFAYLAQTFGETCL